MKATAASGPRRQIADRRLRVHPAVQRGRAFEDDRRPVRLRHHRRMDDRNALGRHQARRRERNTSAACP